MLLIDIDKVPRKSCFKARPRTLEKMGEGTNCTSYRPRLRLVNQHLGTVDNPLADEADNSRRGHLAALPGTIPSKPVHHGRIGDKTAPMFTCSTRPGISWIVSAARSFPPWYFLCSPSFYQSLPRRTEVVGMDGRVTIPIPDS
jgi:hypothetical protein